MAVTLSEVKFWEAMGEEISIHMSFSDCPAEVLRNFPTSASVIFSTFCATNSRSSDMNFKTPAWI